MLEWLEKSELDVPWEDLVVGEDTAKLWNYSSPTMIRLFDFPVFLLIVKAYETLTKLRTLK